MLQENIPSVPTERESEKGRVETNNGTPKLEARIPSGPIQEQWDKCRFEMKLVNPANRRKHSIIVVGAGLAGAAAAATLGQQGYHVHCFSYHDTPRRAHSIAAQGGINAAKNYRNDGDSVFRLFKDTVKGGDYRAREANVYRLAQISLNIIDQCVAQGVPFAREYGGLSTIDRLAACRFHEHFMRAARRDSSCCSGRIRRWKSRSRPARSPCIPAASSST
jgi:FAD binding domain